MKNELVTQGTQIQELLGLKLPAVAIAFRDTPPAGIPRVTSPTAAGCGYWKLAAEGQVFYTEASDHYTCPVGAHTHGIDLPPQVATELNGMVQTMVGMQYLTLADIHMIPRRQGTFHVSVYAPLAQATFTPDVVLVRGTVKQLMLLAEAAQAAGIAGGGATSLETSVARDHPHQLPKRLANRKRERVATRRLDGFYYSYPLSLFLSFDLFCDFRYIGLVGH